MIRVGVEHEFVFADRSGRYLDAESASYSLFSSIVDAFPAIPGDDAHFDCKSLETYPKRVYVEGFERHDATGRTVETLPKGLEIRTLPHTGVDAVVKEFCTSFEQVMRLAERARLTPVLTSRHPFKTNLELDAFSDRAESAARSQAQLALAVRAMLTHGTHVNVSLENATMDRMQDLLAKVTFYTPALIPWSFSSPFLEGKVFAGLCSRNYLRAGTRNMASLENRRGSLVLEFRGFDACGDWRLLTAVLRLFCGFIMDESLPGRASVQDPERLRLSSMHGFSDTSVREEGMRVMQAARSALGNSDSFDLLESMLHSGDSYTARIKCRYRECGNIVEAVSGWYDFRA